MNKPHARKRFKHWVATGHLSLDMPNMGEWSVTVRSEPKRSDLLAEAVRALGGDYVAHRHLIHLPPSVMLSLASKS